MKRTKHVSARLSHLDINKIKRYFYGPTIRDLLEAIIQISENNTYIKNKLQETLNKNGK